MTATPATLPTEVNEKRLACVPARDPRIDEKGNLIIYPKDHPMWRPKKGDEEDDENKRYDPKD